MVVGFEHHYRDRWVISLVVLFKAFFILKSSTVVGWLLFSLEEREAKGGPSS